MEVVAHKTAATAAIVGPAAEVGLQALATTAVLVVDKVLAADKESAPLELMASEEPVAGIGPSSLGRAAGEETVCGVELSAVESAVRLSEPICKGDGVNGLA